jgi:hypothetical protein
LSRTIRVKLPLSRTFFITGYSCFNLVSISSGNYWCIPNDFPSVCFRIY